MTNAVRTIGVLVLAALLATGCGGKQDRLAGHLTKGRGFYAQGVYDKARIETRNALQIDPKNAEAFFLLGMIDEEQQEWQRAYANYAKAVELDPLNLSAKVRLGRIHLFAGKVAEAEVVMKAVLAKQPADPGGLFLKAALLARQGDASAAIREASAAVTSDPRQGDAVSLLAALYARQGDEARAIKVLEDGIQANPKNVAFHKDVAAIAAQRGDDPTLERALREIVRIEPRPTRHRAALAAFYANRNQPDRAEKVLRESVQSDPEDLQRYFLLVEFLATRKDPGEAEKELAAAIEAKPKSHTLKFALARLYESTNRPQDAEQIYRKVVSEAGGRPAEQQARVLLARGRLAAGNAAEAEKLLDDVLAINKTDSEALRLRARISLAKGNARQAIPDLRVVLRGQPEDLEVIGMLASALIANNERQLARDVYENAIVRYPLNSSLRLALVRFLAQGNDMQGAFRELEAALKADTNNAGARQLKAELQIAQKDWKSAESTLREYKTAFPADPIADYQMGMLYLAQNKPDQAIVEHERALKKAPNAIEPLTGIVTALLAQGRFDKAVGRINNVIDANPANMPAYSLLATVYARQKKYDEAEATLRRAGKIDQRASGPYLELADLFVQRGDTAAAISTLQQGASANPADALRLRYALAETYSRADERAKAVAEYEAILQKDPGADVAANNLAALLSEDRANKLNVQRAFTLAKRFDSSSNPAFLDTLGWIYFQMDDVERALPLLRKSVELAPNVPVRHYHLGIALYRLGDVKAAKTHLQLAIDSKAKFVGQGEAREVLSRL